MNPAVISKAPVLIVDDEEDILELVRYNLEREGFSVICAQSGEESIRLARAQMPGVILLDLMLPDIDGNQVCRRLKNDPQTAHVPVVMLTAKGEESDVVLGLEMGADDYIVKPFSPRVLAARVKAVLRRAAAGAEDADYIRRGTIVIFIDRREVRVDGKPVALTPTEFGILVLLIKRPGWVYSRWQIVDKVRGEDYPVTDRTVDVHIASLRKKLGAAGKSIKTVHGIGYRFEDQHC